MEKEAPLTAIQVEALVVMKIIKHSSQSFPTVATGSLVGLDVADTLQVTNTFPFPVVEMPPESHFDTSTPNAAAAAPRAKANTVYQAEMIRMLREVNVDAQNVGWYTSANMGNFINLTVIENQFFYQKELNERTIALVHDVSRSSQGSLSLRAFRLSSQFMNAFKENKFTSEQLQKSGLRYQDILVELPVKIHNSHLLTSFLHQLPSPLPSEPLDLPPSLSALTNGLTAQSNVLAPNFDNLSLSIDPFLEKNCDLLLDAIETHHSENNNFQYYQRSLAREQQKIAAWQAKRKAENISRATLKQPLLPEDEWQRLFKLPQEPSRLESMLNTRQVEQYSRQIDGVFEGYYFKKKTNDSNREPLVNPTLTRAALSYQIDLWTRSWNRDDLIVNKFRLSTFEQLQILGLDFISEPSSRHIWLAGAIAAFTVDFIVYPLDTLKTRIQSPRYRELYIDTATGAARRGVLYRGLYQGIWSVVIATIPSSGAFFTTYEGVKYILNSNAKRVHDDSDGSITKGPFPFTLPTPVINGLASSAAECVSCFILTPAEVLKQNAQMVTSPHDGKPANRKTKWLPSSSSSSSTTYKTKPTMQVISMLRAQPTQLWRGYGALVARNLPFTAMQFPLFEHLREQMFIKWRQKNQQRNLSGRQTITERASITALSAGMAGGIAAAITTPIDVVKTRIMLAVGENERSSTAAAAPSSSSSSWMENTKTSSFTVGREIFRKEGIRGLFTGGTLRAGWTALGLGLYLSAYETGRMYFENRRARKEGE
ncbi:hypothetical protein UA08_05472 [Talaromyces atroroseus]|uniref:Eukaryotic translation initiation factor 3 subunit H n=1 Tax=Talaromyces atroroseus TaxID=1441469 RepID=A0A225AXT9_TALAT|nr:hypothetical protein UA08_05472 [Talaromyces atroroseus]OKL59265.1 hypothetical protein UA08_05472 [Talaromyces atroroseus]